MSEAFWKLLWFFFVRLQLNFLEFCNNFVPNFEKLYYFLYLNTSDSNNGSISENSELKTDCSENSHKNACLEIENEILKIRHSENVGGQKNANGNQAVFLENRLKGNFVNKNVVNFCKKDLNDAETSLFCSNMQRYW